MNGAGFYRSTTGWVFAGILFLGLLAMTARTATDPDLWWHLRTGQWIVETRHIPHTDPFSLTREGGPWISHEWLSEVLFYELWKVAGGGPPIALIVFSSLVTTAGFLLLYWRCPASPQWAATATVLGAYASAPCWGVRPQMFTFLLGSLLLFLLERAEHRPVLLLLVPPLFLLWLNLHGGFALGPALLVLYGGGLVLEGLAGTAPWREIRPLLGRVLSVTLACLVLVPLNPSGVRLYLYPIYAIGDSEIRSVIVEWFSPDFHRSMYFPFLLVLLLLVGGLGWSRSHPRARVLVPLIFMLMAALDAVRHVPIFILLAIPVLASVLSATFPTAIAATRGRRPRLRMISISGALAMLGVFAVWRFADLAHSQTQREADLFPARAVAYLRANDMPPRLFTYYDWGGYALWNLYPQYRTFADGRADLYGDVLLKQAARTVPDLRNGWRTVLDDWNIQTILVPSDAALAQGLFLDSGWSARYSDSQAVIFVRNRLGESSETRDSGGPGSGPGTPLWAGVTSGTIVKIVRK